MSTYTKFTYVGLALLVVSASGVQGKEPAESLSRRVWVADLDFSDPKDARIAYERLTSAADYLCRKFMSGNSASDWQTYADCVQDAVDAALAQIDTRARVALLIAEANGRK
jgi:UrcA family protein